MFCVSIEELDSNEEELPPGSSCDELDASEKELVSCTLDELYSDDEDSLSLETDVFMEDDEELSFFSLEELLLVEDDEDLSFGSLEELLFSDDDSVFLLDELPFTEEDDVLVCFTLDELAFAELEESFSLLEDSTSCSREELDSTNSGWVEELLELSSPQDTNRQTALNGINNRFNMDIRSLLQVLIDQYIHFLDLFHPDRAKNAVQRRKKTAIKAARNCSKLLNFTSFCNNRLGAICKEIPAYAGMTG